EIWHTNTWDKHFNVYGYFTFKNEHLLGTIYTNSIRVDKYYNTNKHLEIRKFIFAPRNNYLRYRCGYGNESDGDGIDDFTYRGNLSFKENIGSKHREDSMDKESEETFNSPSEIIRKNFNETVFFYPNL